MRSLLPFLEHQIVALQAERIARQFQNDAVVAAERKLVAGIELALGQSRRELDAAAHQHIGRCRNDDGTGIHAALCGHDVDATLDRGVHFRDRRRQLHRQPGAKVHQQRAETLPAECIHIALGGFREIHRRDVAQILAAAEWAEEKFHHRPQIAEIVGQRFRAGDVRLAAHGILDRAIAAHERGQKIFKLALARVAAPDAQALSRRGGVDTDARALRKLRDRIDLRHMDPVRAEIDRDTPEPRVGQAASADIVGRLENERALSRCLDAPRRRDPGRAGADDRDIGTCAARLAKGRRGGKPRGGGEKRASADLSHGFRKVSSMRGDSAKYRFSANGRARRAFAAQPNGKAHRLN